MASNDTSTTGPSRPKSPAKGQPRPTPWQVMREAREDDVHPFWIHTLTTAGLAFLGAAGASATHLPWWAWVAVFFGAVFVGGVIGSAGTTSAGSERIHTFGTAYGMFVGIQIAGLSLYASVGDFYHHPTTPGVWLAIGVASVLNGTVYLKLWSIVIETRDHRFERAVVETSKRSGDAWQQAFSDCGFGDVTVFDSQVNWGNVRFKARLDPTRSDGFAEVDNKKRQLVNVAHRLLRMAGGDGLGLGEIRVHETSEVDVIAITIRTRDALTSTFDPSWPGDPAEFAVTDPSTPIGVGYWQSGDPINVPVQGPNTIAIGASGGGKTTLFNALMSGYAQRLFVAQWAAGMSKYGDLVNPILQAAADAGGKPILTLCGGGDSGSREDFLAAARVVACAYILTLSRMQRTDLPEKVGSRWVPSPEHPVIKLFLDEIDALTKYAELDKDGIMRKPLLKLPSGQHMHVWGMLEVLTSKGRSLGVEVVCGAQRATDGWWGGQVMNLLTNISQRFLFHTGSAHDTSTILKQQSDQAKAMRLSEMQHAMLAALRGEKTAVDYGKAIFHDYSDLVELHRVANAAGTIGVLGDDEQAILGTWYTGEQPVPVAAASDTAPATTEAAMRAEIERRMSEAGVTLPKTTEPDDDPLEPAGDNGTEPPGEPRPAGDSSADWVVDALRQLDELPTADEVEYTAHVHDNPIELLAHLVNEWEVIAAERPIMTAKEIVEQFGLLWLGGGKPRNAAQRLGNVLRGVPIEVEPKRTNTGMAYAFQALSDAWGRIEAEADDDTDDA